MGFSSEAYNVQTITQVNEVIGIYLMETEEHMG